MSEFIDYAALKRDVTIEQVAVWLGLELKKVRDQFQGPCPLHSGSNQRMLKITPDYQHKDGSVGAFYCFAPECRAKWPLGGDLIELTAKIRGISKHEAAVALSKAFCSPKTVPRLSKLPEHGLDLETTHEALQALGLSPETARYYGVGYATKGIMRGRICFPLRGENGELHYVGYAEGLEPKLKFPVRFM